MDMFKSRGKHAASQKSASSEDYAESPVGAAGDEAASIVDDVEGVERPDEEADGSEVVERTDDDIAGDGAPAGGDADAVGAGDGSGSDESGEPDDSEPPGESGSGEPEEGEPAADAPTEAITPAADAAPTAAIPPAADAAPTAAIPPIVPIAETPAGKGAGEAAQESQPGFVAAGFSEIPSKKRRTGLKVLGITLGIVVVAALVAYIAGAVVFMGRFLPNTKIGEYDVSLKTDEEVVALLEDVAADYRLDVVGNGFSYRATGKDLGLSIDGEGIVQDVHSDLNSWEWPLLLLEQSHDEDKLDISFKQSLYQDAVTEAVAKFNETAKDPVNATIAFDKKNDRFVVQPEEAGTKLDADAVMAAISSAITSLDTKVSLGDEHLIQPAVFSTDEKLIAAAELATGMVSADLTLVMGGKEAGKINGEMLSGFITVDENYSVVFKEDEMNAWVDSLIEGLNTVGTERTYTRADGKAIAVSGGSYGWEVDTEELRNAVIEGIKAGTAAEIEVPCTETAEVFNGANQRDWGNRYVDVDITEQHVRFYGDNGEIIWEADCISGSPDGKHDTVKGVWYVNAKESPSKLVGYENGKKIYETSVKFWMPFEGNSIGFHDATWQPSFGGSMYANGYGSHGCVNLSYSDAETLYGIIEEGDVVVVHA